MAGKLPTVAIADNFREEAEMYALGLSAFGLRTVPIVTDDAKTAAKRILRLKPDAVVTRILPERFGITLTTLLRAERTTATIPIVVVTSLMQREVHDAARAAGASTVLLLPVTPEQIAVLIKAELRQSLTA